MIFIMKIVNMYFTKFSLTWIVQVQFAFILLYADRKRTFYCIINRPNIELVMIEMEHSSGIFAWC